MRQCISIDLAPRTSPACM